MSTYTFLSHVRQGVAAAIDTAPNAANPSATVTLSTGQTVAIPLRLYRPGDITSIDPRVVVRTEPRHLVTDFAPNFFAFIEFDRPDFPWLLTPPGTPAPVMPWVCLVVVPKDKVPPPANPARDALPVLKCPVDELPDLSEAWAWAHAQALCLSGESVEDVLREAPDRNVSRLLCPRRLDPNRSYYACVVPAFRAGVAAGLGQTPADNDTAPAWSSASAGGSAAAAPVDLPVYYFWEFATAEGGDFEALVRRLRKSVLVPDVGKREMLLDRAAPVFPDAGPTGLEGALTSPALERREWPGRDGRTFVAALERAIAAKPRTPDEPSLGPPAYGAAHVGATTLSGAAPPWLRELNLDPRYRVAAALGVRVVQEQQEHLMASAWEQLGEIREANQLLHQAQLARVAGERTHAKRFAPFAPATAAAGTIRDREKAARMLQLAAPVLGRIVRDGATLAHGLRGSSLPAASLSPAFRRASRPRGPIARRMARPPAGERMIAGLARGDIVIDVAPGPRGLVTLDAVIEDATTGPTRGGSGSTRDRARGLSDFSAAFVRERASRSGPSTTPPRGGLSAPAAGTSDTRFSDAAAGHQDAILSLAAAAPAPGPASIDLVLVDEARRLVDRLKPSVTLPPRIGDRIRRPPGEPAPADPLTPIVANPVFPQAMYQPLRDLGHEFVMPGLDRVPPNTVVEIAVNRRFIESYLAGLNHEMARELLWREFPADLRATYFHRFWEPAPGASAGRDITDVHSWTGALGTHAAEPSGELLVLLIRGDLVKRYPGAIVYMVKATWNAPGRYAAPDAEERHPLFRGALDPDVLFVGFRMSAAAARGSSDPSGDAGWYLVIQEQPTELRFGLDEPSVEPAAALADWANLTWDHPAVDRRHVRVAGPLSGVGFGGVRWGEHAASMARILLQPPVRLLMHAITLFPVE